MNGSNTIFIVMPLLIPIFLFAAVVLPFIPDAISVRRSKVPILTGGGEDSNDGMVRACTAHGRLEQVPDASGPSAGVPDNSDGSLIAVNVARLAVAAEDLVSAASKITQADDAYRTAQLALEQTRQQVRDLEARHDATTTSAQQFLIVDVAIVGVVAAAAIGVKQISLQLTQLYSSRVPVRDATLTRAGLVGLVILAAAAILSAICAAIAFLGERTELGPTAGSLAEEGKALSPADQVMAAAVVWEEARRPALDRLQAARRLLLAAVTVLSLGVLAAPVVAILVWR